MATTLAATRMARADVTVVGERPLSRARRCVWLWPNSDGQRRRLFVSSYFPHASSRTTDSTTVGFSVESVAIIFTRTVPPAA